MFEFMIDDYDEYKIEIFNIGLTEENINKSVSRKDETDSNTLDILGLL